MNTLQIAGQVAHFRSPDFIIHVIGKNSETQFLPACYCAGVVLPSLRLRAEEIVQAIQKLLELTE